MQKSQRNAPRWSLAYCAISLISGGWPAVLGTGRADRVNRPGSDEDRRLSQDAGFNYHIVRPLEHASLEALLADAKWLPQRNPSRTLIEAVV